MIEILKQYNFWENSQKISTGMIRNSYLDKITAYFDSNLIKVIIGQRRVGKSFILRQIIHTLIEQKKTPRKNIFYLNKEILEFKNITNIDDLKNLFDTYQKTIKPKGKIYIFIDEIQEIQNFEKFINSYAQDYTRSYEIFISGSNAHLLSSELATLLTGRYILFEIFPFSFSEYTNFQSLEKNKQNFENYLLSGAMPSRLLLPSAELKREYSQSLIHTILFKDIIQRHNIKNTSLLSDLTLFLADNTANTFSCNAIVKELLKKNIHTNNETLSSYLDFLKKSFLIHSISNFNIQGKKILQSPQKYYLNDIGLKHFLLPSFDYGLSKQLENHIFLHYKRQGYQIYTGKIYEKEIDFIIQKGKEKKYIQVAHSLTSEKVIQREFGNLEKIKDHYPKEVITIDDINYGNKNGIQHTQAWLIDEI